MSNIARRFTHLRCHRYIGEVAFVETAVGPAEEKLRTSWRKLEREHWRRHLLLRHEQLEDGWRVVHRNRLICHAHESVWRKVADAEARGVRIGDAQPLLFRLRPDIVSRRATRFTRGSALTAYPAMPTVSVYCSPCTCPDPYVSMKGFFASTAVVLFEGLKRVCPWQFGEHVGPGTNRSLLPVSNWTVNGRGGVPTVSVPCQSSPWFSSVSGTVPFGSEDDARRRRSLPALPVVLSLLLPSSGLLESGRIDNGCASPVLVS